MGKLGWKERKAVETFLQLLKICPADKVPQSIYDELEKHGIVKEEGETMDHFSEKIKNHIKNVEKKL